MNAKKRALGKGLSALLDRSGFEDKSYYDVNKDLLAVGTVGKVPINIIEPNPYQPRSNFDAEAMNELANSIKEQGVIQPITLRKIEDNKLQLVSGERRLKAAKMAGLTDIPAYIVIAEDRAMLEIAIVENIQRENLNPIEIALGYKQLIEDHGLTQEKLSERLGKSRPSISNHLRLLNLPGDIQIGLRQELISMGHAKALLAVRDLQTLNDLYQDILVQQLSVREVEEIIKNLEDSDQQEEKPELRKTTRPGPTEAQLTFQKELEELFSTTITIKSNKKGKGSIVIGFKSPGEFERIASLLKK